ncbi:MAG TPA: penicillin-binding protein 2 [Paracoccaceae bacterium]|nr:penicillin-binding protein 2 [Paracoccaceae bacterium]
MTDIAPQAGARGRAAMRGDWRIILLMAGFCVCYAAVAVRMGLMATIEPEEPQISRDGGPTLPIRGEIVDRDGKLLAGNLPAWSLYAHPQDIRDPGLAADELARIFPDMTRDELLRDLTSDSRFVWIKRPVTPREKQAVHELGLPGLHFGNREMRIYPAGAAMAHIVGGVRAGREGVRFAELVGAGGVEGYFDERLRDPELAGEPLRLSLDLAVQQVVREALTRGVDAMNAIGGAAILMKVGTGEVLAMVSVPDFDPNAPPQPFYGDAGQNPRFNRAAQARYELGSTFKVLTTAIALETGAVEPGTLIETPPTLRYGRHTIHDFHRMPPIMTVEEIVVESSNVGSAKLALMVGTPRFKAYLGKLGMLDPSGIELVGASDNDTLIPERWTDLSTITISFGHGLAASPMHLAAAFATVANGGVRVYPSLVAGGRESGPRVFSEQTSREMLRIMRQVVINGTASRADVPGYRVGGKTGTADKVRPNGGYYDKKVISTFAAVFPTTRPEFVLVVSLDEPTNMSAPVPARTAGWTAAPVTAEIIRRAVAVMGIRPLPAPVPGDIASLGASWE